MLEDEVRASERGICALTKTLQGVLHLHQLLIAPKCHAWVSFHASPKSAGVPKMWTSQA